MVAPFRIKVFFLIGFMAFPPTVSGAYTDLDVKLFNAAQKGNVELIEDLLEKGADINVKLGVDQWTPLMTASREGKTRSCQILA